MGQIILGFFVLCIFIYMSILLFKSLDELIGSDYLLNSFLYIILWVLTCIFYCYEVMSDIAVNWYLFKYFSRSMAFVSLLIFVFKLTDPFFKTSPKIILIFFIIPIFTGIFSMLNTFRSFIFKDIEIIKFYPEKIIILEKGIWYYIDFAYGVLCLCAVIYIFAKLYKEIPSIFKAQYKLYITAFSIILLFQILDFSGIVTTYDISLIGTIIGCYILFWTVKNFTPSELLLFAKDAVFQKISCVCLVTENDGTIMVSNPEAEKFFSFMDIDLKGIKYEELINFLIKEKQAVYEYEDNEKILKIELDDKLLFFQIFESQIYDRNKRKIGNFVEMRDITIQQELITELYDLANYDQLTNLYNRRYFDIMCEKLNQNKYLPLCVISGDLNKLKITNDRYGHKVGDRLLVVMGEILKKNAPEGAIISRHGGDEFLVLLTKTNEKTAKEYIERVHKACAEYWEEPFGSPSIALGYAIKYRLEEDFEEVLITADLLMYNMKRKAHIKEAGNKELFS